MDPAVFLRNQLASSGNQDLISDEWEETELRATIAAAALLINGALSEISGMFDEGRAGVIVSKAME